MDTESFLLERSRLVNRVEGRRQALRDGMLTPRRWLGIPLPRWSHLLLGLAANRAQARWLSGMVLSAGMPMMLGLLRGRSLSFLVRKSLMNRLGAAFTRLWKRR